MSLGIINYKADKKKKLMRKNDSRFSIKVFKEIKHRKKNMLACFPKRSCDIRFIQTSQHERLV